MYLVTLNAFFKREYIKRINWPFLEANRLSLGCVLCSLKYISANTPALLKTRLLILVASPSSIWTFLLTSSTSNSMSVSFWFVFLTFLSISSLIPITSSKSCWLTVLWATRFIACFFCISTVSASRFSFFLSFFLLIDDFSFYDCSSTFWDDFVHFVQPVFS